MVIAAYGEEVCALLATVPAKLVVLALPETFSAEGCPTMLHVPEQPAPVEVNVIPAITCVSVIALRLVGVIAQEGAALTTMEYATGVPLMLWLSVGVIVKLEVPGEPEGVPEIVQF